MSFMPENGPGGIDPETYIAIVRPLVVPFAEDPDLRAAMAEYAKQNGYRRAEVSGFDTTNGFLLASFYEDGEATPAQYLALKKEGGAWKVAGEYPLSLVSA